MNEKYYEMYREVLIKDLLPAMGCTEPIALALAGAKTREMLGGIPVKATVYCSGNLIKNVKAVTIPNTNGRRGIETAVAMGIACGDSGKELEILESADENTLKIAEELWSNGSITVCHEEGVENLYVRIEASSAEHSALVEMVNHHNMYRRVELDGQVVFKGESETVENEFGDFAVEMTPDSIFEYAVNVPIMNAENSELRSLLKKQVDFNTAIGKEGIGHGSGAAIGKLLMSKLNDNDPVKKGTALAAGGSDARMSGCKMPVVINSGSGNQGITIACPIAVYCEENSLNEEKMYRALLMANLIAIYEKCYIGKLSAYCGAVSAAAAAGAGIAYLADMSREQIMEVVSNTLAIGSGILCDGAKASCAAKIAASLNCMQMALDMAKAGTSFLQGEGIVAQRLEETIHNVGCIAQDGMRVTDREILKVMLEYPYRAELKGC